MPDGLNFSGATPLRPAKPQVDLERLADEEGVPRELVRGLKGAEGPSSATSGAGAQGALQVIPATGLRYVSPQEWTTLEGKARAGVRYIRHLTDTFGIDNADQIAAAYHAGEGAVTSAVKRGRRLPHTEDRVVSAARGRPFFTDTDYVPRFQAAFQSPDVKHLNFSPVVGAQPQQQPETSTAKPEGLNFSGSVTADNSLPAQSAPIEGTGRGAAMARVAQAPPITSLRGTKTRPMVPKGWEGGGAVGEGVTEAIRPRQPEAPFIFGQGAPKRVEVGRPFTFAGPDEKKLRASIQSQVAAEMAPGDQRLFDSGAGRQDEIAAETERRLNEIKSTQARRTGQVQEGDVVQAAPESSVTDRLKQTLDSLIEKHAPGIAALDTPEGIKTDLLRGIVHGATLGAVGQPKPADSQEEIIPGMTRFGLGETVGSLAPLIATEGMLPAGFSPAARTAATFGATGAGRQAVNAVEGRPVDLNAPLVDAALGLVMGKLAGADPSMLRRVAAYVAPGLAMDIAQGASKEDAAHRALVNLGFAVSGGGREGVPGRIEPKADFKGQTVPEDLQARLQRGENVSTTQSQELSGTKPAIAGEQLPVDAGAVQPSEAIEKPTTAPVAATVIRHSDPRIDGGEVIGRTGDGKLKVANNEGGVSVVQNPRTQGNREATIVKTAKVEQASQPAKVPQVEPSMAEPMPETVSPVLPSEGGVSKSATVDKVAPVTITRESADELLRATEVVDGRKVRSDIPNEDSIGASFNDYDVLPGIREVPMSAFEAPGDRGSRHGKQLAEKINQSGEINPLIVAIDAEGPYILEGGGRYDALTIMGAKSFPAKIVIDRDVPPAPQEGPKAAEQPVTKAAEPQIVQPETPTPDVQRMGKPMSEVGTQAKSEPTNRSQDSPIIPDFVRRSQEYLDKRATEKAQGIEYRHAGVDPTEPYHRIVVKGWELYDQTIKPTFQEWSKKIRDEFGPDADAHLRTVFAQLSGNEQSDAESIRQTGIKHAVVEAERELQGLPQFTKARRAAGVSFDEGVAAVRSGEIDPRVLARDQATAIRARPLSTTESMALLYDRMRISQARKAAEIELEAASKSGDEARLTKAVDKVSELKEASNFNDEADYRTGSELGRGLAIRRELIRDDYSRARVLSRAIAINKGKPLPPEVQAKYEAVVEQLAKAHGRISELETQQESKTAEAEVEKVTRQMARELRSQGRKRSIEAIKADRAAIRQNAAQAWAKQKALLGKEGTLSQGGLGSLDPEGELTRSLRDLARTYIEEGVVKASDVVDAVHEHIKDVAEGITKRQVSDLISGYGRTKESVSDPIEKKLNEIKSILASTSGKSDVLEKEIRASRRGQQQAKPTEDQRRALRDLQDAMREKGPELAKKPYDVKAEQATPLDKAKTTTRNRMEQLRKWIADGKREVQGQNKTIPDAELNQLKAERTALERVAALLDDPAADQKAVEKRLGELSKSLAAEREKIQSGNVTPEIKEGAKQLWTPEIGALSKERDALRGIMADMRSAAAKAKADAALASQSDAPFYGAKGSWAEYEAEAKSVLNRQKGFMQRNQKKMAELQKELERAQRGEQKAAKEKRIPVPFTDEMRVAQRNANVLKRQIDQLDAVVDWTNLPWHQKGLAYGAASVRASVLSGVKVLGKIGGALTNRIPQQYLEEGAGKGWAKLFPETAAKAPRHGAGINVESEKAFGRGLISGAKEIPSIVKTGESELTLAHSKRYPTIPTKLGTALAIPGRIHMAEKNILKVAEYGRSLELNLQKAEREGLSRTNPEVRAIAEERAYKDAEEAILLGDSAFGRSLTNMQRSWRPESRSLFKIAVPVARVPANYLSQAIGEYGLGIPRGLMRARPEIKMKIAKSLDSYGPEIFKQAARALRERNPELMDKLTPEEADKTMRLLKRGTLGALYMGLIGSGLVAGGGYYSGKRKEGDLHPGDVQIAGITIPHWAMHSPPVEMAQLVATIKREVQNATGKQGGKSPTLKAATGVAYGAKGLAEQTPFLNQYTRMIDSFRSGEALMKMLGDQVASRVEPQIIKELAAASDREEAGTPSSNPYMPTIGRPTMVPWKGQPVQRQVKTFSDAMKIGLPGARQTLKIDRKKMRAQSAAP